MLVENIKSSNFMMGVLFYIFQNNLEYIFRSFSYLVTVAFPFSLPSIKHSRFFSEERKTLEIEIFSLSLDSFNLSALESIH